MADVAPLTSVVGGAGRGARSLSITIDVLKNAVPTMLTNLLMFANETTNTVFIGHHASEDALAAVGLGNMMQNVFGLSVGIGIISALDTLVSQAHGSGDTALACVYLQRARLISSLQLVWIVPVLACSDVLLVAIGQDLEVARFAWEYNSSSVLFMFFFFQQCAMQGFLRNQQCPNAATGVALVTAVLHVLWCALFVGYFQLGNRGIGLANGTTWTLQFALLSGYLWRVAPHMGFERRHVLGIQRDAWRGWHDYMRVAMPALLQCCGEWWFWEITAVIVGYLGATALAAHVSALNYVGLAFMMVLGISAAATTLVGNAVGAGLPGLARETVWVCSLLNLIVWTLACAFTLSESRTLARMYSADPNVQNTMDTLLIIFAFVGFFDSSQNVMGGALRGLGRLQAASAVYFTAYYAVMLPVALVLAFPLAYGVAGVWCAMGIGTGAATVSFTVLLACTSYEQMVRDASARLSQDRAKATSSPGGASSEAALAVRARDLATAVGA